MIEPYWMVFTNVVLSIILLFFILLFRFFYPKKSINYPVLLFLIAILPCVSIFRNGVYQSGDFTQHIERAMVFYGILKEGILIPSWANILNSGYGYPVFLFIYLLPYYLISFIHFFGVSFIFSEKILLAVSYISSGLIMYIVLNKMTKNALAAFSGSVIYLFTPYHLVDLHFRVDLPETLSFAIAPLIFFFILKLEETNKIFYAACLALLYGFFFLAHPPSFLFYSGLFFIYLIYSTFFLRKVKFHLFLNVFLSFLVGLLISSYSWLSRFTLSKYTYGSYLVHTPVTFVQFWQLLYSPWRYGFLFQGHEGELSYLIGYTQILVLIFAIFVLIKTARSHALNYQLLFWTTISIPLIFLMLPYSKSIWDMIPLLNLMQFSYRLLHPLTFCLSICTAYIVLRYKNNKKIIFLFILLTIGYTILNWGNRSVSTKVTDSTIRQNLENASREEEGMFEAHPIWWNSKTDFWISPPPKYNIQIIKGSGMTKEIYRTSTIHTYLIYATMPITVLENTFYFPDWTVSIDSRNTKINYTSSLYPARIVFNVPKGLHYVQVKYFDILPIELAKILSLIVTFCIMLYILYYIYSEYLQLYIYSILIQIHKYLKLHTT